MSERWTDSDPELLPSGLSEMLRAGREPLGTRDEVAELGRRLAAVLGPAAGLTSDAPGAPEPPPDPQSSGDAVRPELASPAGASGALKPTLGLASRGAWVLAGAGAAAIGLMAFFFLRGAGDPAPAPALPPSPPEVVEAAPSVAAPAPTPSERADAPRLEATDDDVASETVLPAVPSPPPRAAGRAPARPGVARRESGDGLSETVLLEQARAALQSRPAAALELTRRHQARFPRGVLAQEREVIAIEALQRLGRKTAARARAAEFERRYRGSVHQPRLLRGSDTSAPAGGAPNTPVP